MYRYDYQLPYQIFLKKLFCVFEWYLMPLSAIFQLYHGVQFLMGEEAGVPGENSRPAVGKLQTLSSKIGVEYTLPAVRIEPAISVLTDHVINSRRTTLTTRPPRPP